MPNLELLRKIASSSQVIKKNLNIGMRYALLIIFLSLLAYLPIKDAAYVWDDDQYLTENRLVRSYSGLKDIWTTTKTPQYYPMVFSSYVVEYSLWGYRPLGYHLSNIAIHIANSLLLALILKTLGIEIYWVIALIFALHPIQVESVAWVTERKNVLSLFFYLCSLLSYLKFEKIASYKFYCFSLVLFILALLSKSTACSLPIILLLITHYQKNRLNLKDVFNTIPFFVLGLVLGLNTAWIEKTKVGAVGKDYDFNFLQKTLIASKASLFYIQKTLLPCPLIFNYPRWEIENYGLVDYWPLAVCAILAVLLSYLWRKNLKTPLYFSVAYLANMFPALGFFAVYPFRYSFVADHFSYLATTALIPALCLLANQALSNKKIKTIFTCLILLTSMGLTWQQTKAYKSEEALWKDTITKNPCSWMSHNNLSGIYRKQHNAKLALQHLNKAIECNPKNYKAYSNRGSTLLFIKQFESAIKDFNTALALKNKLPTALCHRGIAKYFTGKYEDASVDIEKSITIKPNSALALGYRGMTNLKLQKPIETVCLDFKAACKLGKCSFLKLPESSSCKP